MNIFEDIGHKLDGVRLTTGLAGTLHYSAVGTLAELLIDMVVLSNNSPEVLVSQILVLIIYHYFVIFKIMIRYGFD